MIILISGASHTGKTALAQRLLERYQIPYLSMDLLKMGLIRSGQTSLTVQDDDALARYLWPIAQEMVKTALENNQNLIVEGIYIPFDWRKGFSPEEQKKIWFVCLVLSEPYIRSHFAQVKQYANVIEKRLDDSWCSMERVLEENRKNERLCREYGCEMILIRENYLEELLEQIGRRFPYDHWLKMRIVEKHQSSE